MAVRSPAPLDGSPIERDPDWTVLIGEPLSVDGPPDGELIGEATHGEFQYWSTTQGADRERWVVRHRHSAETTFERSARTITLRTDPRVSQDYSLLLLAGSGMAHALVADGHSAMHASAVETDGRAIAFIGPSGRGKTTLAALLCDAGARAVTDDVLRCELEGESAFCFRGSSRLRLRPQAAALAGAFSPDLTADGRTAARPEQSRMERIPLAALVAPNPNRDAKELYLRRLRGREAAAELLRSPRLSGFIDPELNLRHLDLCQGLAARVPVLEATVPWGPPFAPGLASQLIERVLSPA